MIRFEAAPQNRPGDRNGSIPACNAPLTLGQAEGAFHSDGFPDEVHTYGRALSADELETIVNATRFRRAQY